MTGIRIQLFISLLLISLSVSVYSQDSKQIVNNSLVAFTIPEKNLIPENLAYNPDDKCFYVGSTHQRKVVKVAPDGTVSDFVREAQDGQWMVVGIKIDSVRQHVWFCSSIGDVMKGYKDDFGKHTGIFKYDLKSGKLIKKYLVEKPGELHFFNDLVLNKAGDVFLTDMEGKAIYNIRASKDELEILCTPANFTDPNGICISPDEKTLFVSTDEGLTSVNIQSGTATLLKHEPSLKVNGIDGLYFYKNSLVAVQNGADRVMQFYLNTGFTEITRSRIIEANHPYFAQNPTTGVIVGSTFYYIANSQFGSFDSNHQIFPKEKLYEVLILKAALF